MNTAIDLRFDHAELAARDRARIIHPFLPTAVEDRVVMVEGRGCRLTDAEGRSYLDATGGLWLAQIGHGRPEPAEAAARQMRQLEYFTSFWEFSNDRAIELADRLARVSPEGLDHVYFTSGGSEGNDAAIRMARLYHHRRGEPSRTWILGRRAGYHGVAYGGGTVTGLPMNHEGFGPGLPDVEHLTPPWPYREELYGGEDCTDFCVRELEETIERIGAENIAAFVGEPVMGVSGMIIPPEDYWPRIAEVLQRHGILLVLDEVVTAYGRIGSWFAADHFGVRPDIIVTAKGITSGYIPLGAVLVRGEVAEVLGKENGFPIGYTYNGHPVACAVALANLDLIEREDLLSAAVKTGGLLGDRLRELEELPVVGEVRQVGMMLGVELVSDRRSREPLLPLISPKLPDVIRRETGVIVRGGQHALVLSPPLVLSRDEALEIADALRSVLERVGPDGSISR
ncbi:aminotransferase family protein [Streptomyces sp. TP-A0874]|uniref:aminotransferase family protein n=1 Tax=Streptomyces sp. TP-A0874 TaxID=549819 RepID=UPI00085398E4|nr:aspartate aminotransferase family protein [Streptomyces sp. TP-A0874]